MSYGKLRIVFIAGLSPMLCMAGNLRLLDYDTGADITGSEVTFAWEPEADARIAGIVKKIVTLNTSEREITIVAKKEELNPLQADVTNSFCFAGYCYAPHIFESPRPQLLPAGGSDRSLNTGLKTAYSFNPSVHRPGIDRVRYVVFDKDNRNDSASVTVNFSSHPPASPIRFKGRAPDAKRMGRIPGGSEVDALGKRLPRRTGRTQILRSGR